MQKVIILESFQLLALRIQNILNQYGYRDITIINNINNYNGNLSKTIEEATLIIADLDSRGYDPLALVKGNYKEIPIIFMGETSDFNKMKQIINAGGKYFLLKPFETELLLSKIAKIIVDDLNDNSNSSKNINEMKEIEIFPKTQIVLEWNKEFETGITQIDEEHKNIIDNYRRLYYEMKNGDGLKYYPELLEFLQDYIITHFVNEQKLQREVGYYDYENHIQKHEDFSKIIRNYVEKEKNSGANYQDLVTISLFIKDWLIHHILIEDRKIGEFINTKVKEE